MKKHLKAALAAMLALVMALTAIPVSALPRFEAEASKAENAAIEPYWTVPDGYNAHDYNLVASFLEQPANYGLTNGERLAEYEDYDYDPNNPQTWGTNNEYNYETGEYIAYPCFVWSQSGGQLRLREIHIELEGLCGVLDVSSCTNLSIVRCGYNDLVELNAAGCSNLVELSCSSNELVELNAAGCSNLVELSCSSNELTQISINGCSALRDLDCSYNRLGLLRFFYNTSIKSVNCSSNRLYALDTSVIPTLTELNCSTNDLSNLNLTNNRSITKLYCYNNNLRELNLSQCNQLKDLDCSCNNLTSLDVSRNPSLEHLTCGNESHADTPHDFVGLNRISSLNLSANRALAGLSCSNMSLSSLDVSNNVQLVSLYCSENIISNVDVSKNKQLEDFICANNRITELDLSNNAKLRFLDCSNNMLTALNLTNNTKIKFLSCSDNRLSELEFSELPILNALGCTGNYFTKIDLTENDFLGNILVETQGQGFVGVSTGGVPNIWGGWNYGFPEKDGDDQYILSASPKPGYCFVGWFDENGNAINDATFIYDNVLYYSNDDILNIVGRTFVAHFSDAVDDVPAEQISGDFTYKSNITDRNEQYTFSYDDSWFYSDSSIYNHDLVKMSVRMAMAGSKRDESNIEALYRQLGYNDIASVFPNPPTSTSIGYSIALKNVVKDGEAISIIAVTIRSGDYGAEWESNGYVDDGIEHAGFMMAANTVRVNLLKYIDDHSDTMHSTIKVWINGYSRGAATSNILAKQLIDDPVYGINSNDIYAFCFECPNTTKADAASDERYNGIINIINPIDFVPMVPLAYWGFTRYGKTYCLPSRIYAPEYSTRYKPRMVNEYQKIINKLGGDASDKNVNIYTYEERDQAGVFLRFSYALGVQTYDSNYYAANLQPHVLAILAETLGSDEPASITEVIFDCYRRLQFLLVRMLVHLPTVIEFSALVLPSSIEYNGEVIAERQCLLWNAHFLELGMAWLDSIEGESDYYNERRSHVTLTNATQGGRSNNSIDVSVYDSNGTIVAQIINNAVVDDETGICAYIDSNDQLCFDFPAGEDYRIEVSSAADTELAITMTKYVGENNTPEKLVSYFDVALSAGDTCTGIVENINENDEPYSLLVNGEEIEPSADLGEDDQIEHLVDVEVEGGGRVYFPGTFVTGEYAKLRVAFNEENFLGWYLDGELLSTAPEYRIMVTEDMLITAKFSTKLGDVNLDGKLSIADTILIARYALGLIELEAPCDLDGNRLISIADAIVSARYALGLIEP